MAGYKGNTSKMVSSSYLFTQIQNLYTKIKGLMDTKANKDHTHDLSKMINTLTVGTSTPTDSDYYISQYVEGGNTTTTYHRRTISTLWDYIKGKADIVYQAKGNYPTSSEKTTGTIDDLYKNCRGTTGGMGSVVITKKPSGIGSEIIGGWYNYIYSPHRTGIGGDNPSYGTIILTPLNFSGTSYIVRCTGDTVTEVKPIITKDTNTWRGIQNNLTSTSTTDSLSANQGKVLKGLVDSKSDKNHTHMIKSTLDLTNLDTNTYYPVVGEPLPNDGFRHIKLDVQLNSGTNPSWSTHALGFTVIIDLLVTASGWGVTSAESICLDNSYSFADKNPAGYHQMYHTSRPCFWLRGGAKYFIFADYDAKWNIKTSAYTVSQETVAPTADNVGLQITRSTICANLNGTASNADTVDGYHADNFAKTSGAYFNGNITIHSAEMNGQYNGLLVGDDCYIGDCNIGNTIGLMGTSNNDIAYIKFGKSGGTLGFDGSNMVFQNNVNVPTIYSDNWFRSKGNSGWYNENYGGGIYMQDSTWVRVFNGKSFEMPNGAMVFRNGLTNPSWGDLNSCLEVKTSDGTIPSICLHRSGHSHVTLGNSVSGELDIGFDGGKWAQAYHTRNITKGTWELTSGVSSLATNNIYIQYE